MGGKPAAVRWAQLDPAGGPDSLAAWARRYLEAGQVQGLSPFTIKARYQDLSWFCRWCVERDLMSPREITKPILERYQRHLFYHRKANGAPLSATRQMLLIVHVKGFFRWLARHNHLLTNPASEIE
ncbi:MAG: site-specific tyrosine recombinase XerC, partial [Burkholderiales bacterium]